MRPRKVVLCVAASEQKLSIQTFVLDTWGYRVLGALSASDALGILQAAEPGTIDLMILNLPVFASDELLEAAVQAQPEIHTVAISAKPDHDLYQCKVDVFLTEAFSFSSELHERLRILTARKRGPKKKPVESVASNHKEVRYG
jgi:two-component system response regulator CpxR